MPPLTFKGLCSAQRKQVGHTSITSVHIDKKNAFNNIYIYLCHQHTTVIWMNYVTILLLSHELHRSGNACYVGHMSVPIVLDATGAQGLVRMGTEDVAPTGISFPDCLARNESLY
jgi:hypothetical protein